MKALCLLPLLVNSIHSFLHTRLDPNFCFQKVETKRSAERSGGSGADEVLRRQQELLDLIASSEGGHERPVQPKREGAKMSRKKKNGKTIASNTAQVIQQDDDYKETLSEKQAEALELIRRGENVFLTGVAGTGKSLVLERAIDFLKMEYGNDGCWVALGPTGPAAIALGGQTIHSFAGISVPYTRGDFQKAWKRKKDWKRLEVMLLDEVSMISGEFFDYLSDVVSNIRRNPKPFGGIQLILCGDFLQLQPIPMKHSDIERIQNATADEADDLFMNRGFAFQAHQWKEAELRTVQLDKVFRQNSSEFIDALQDIRTGSVSSKTLLFLSQCDRPLPPNPYGVRPTILHSTNRNVANENMSELAKLPGNSHTFHAVDSVRVEKTGPPWAEDFLNKNAFFKNCIAENKLELKVGAQVMLLKNEHMRWWNSNTRAASCLSNGSRGKVVGFEEFQGSTDGLNGNDSVQHMTATEHEIPRVERYPVVQFMDGTTKIIRGQKFASKLVGIGTCERIAIPLRLAWAITTHKSQGLTLDYVIADVGGVFTEAQAYVAISRASDANGLELRHFSQSKVRANPEAVLFYNDPYGSFDYWDQE